MVIKNKRGWLRVFEAVLAIILIMGSILLIYRSQQISPQTGSYIEDWQKEILTRIAEDESLRNNIVENKSDPVWNFINASLLPNLNFSIKICNLTGPCPLEFYPGGDIFAQERIISGTIEKYDPKKLRFFVWFKE